MNNKKKPQAMNEIRSLWSALISIASAGFGTTVWMKNYEFLMEVGAIDVLLQRLAWLVAIVAGIYSLIARKRKNRANNK